MIDTNPDQIKSRIIKTDLINWKELCFIQQENFKEWFDQGDEKLKQSLLKYNFVDPYKVWFDGEKLWCLDGYHRWLDLVRIQESGTPVPDLLPATFIDCADITEAAELVLVYSSSYAQLSRQGLYDFVSKYDLDIQDIKNRIEIPEFSFDRFEQEFNLYSIDNNENELIADCIEKIIIKEGDLFEINGHRIICGSFTDSDIVKNLMNGSKARILNCDPPYNLPTDFFLKDNKHNHNHEDFAMAAGEMSDEEFVAFLASIMRTAVLHTVPGAIHYIFMDFRHVWHMTEAGYKVYGTRQPKQICVWNKDIMANGSFYRAKHELCFVFSSQQAEALWNNDLLDMGGFYKNNNEMVFIFKNGADDVKHLSHLDLKDRIRTNVWNYPSSNSTANPDRNELKNHPTPKPVSMIADAILDTTNPGDLVIDFFLGSGTCLIACEKTKRYCRGSDISPKYIQNIIKRYIQYCHKNNIGIDFRHINGNLTLNDFAYETNPISYGSN